MAEPPSGTHRIEIDIPYQKVTDIAEEQGILMTHREAQTFLEDRIDALEATILGSIGTFIGNHAKAWTRRLRRERRSARAG